MTTYTPTLANLCEESEEMALGNTIFSLRCTFVTNTEVQKKLSYCLSLFSYKMHYKFCDLVVSSPAVFTPHIMSDRAHRTLAKPEAKARSNLLSLQHETQHLQQAIVRVLCYHAYWSLFSVRFCSKTMNLSQIVLTCKIFHKNKHYTVQEAQIAV